MLLPARLLALAAIVLAGLIPACDAGAEDGNSPLVIEAFTTSGRPFRGVDAVRHTYPGTTLWVHWIDAIEEFEVRLSKDLPHDPEAARRLALSRLNQLSPNESNELEQAARALAAAIELGIERVPAVVFNGKSVIYGVTDLETALDLYLTRSNAGRR